MLSLKFLEVFSCAFLGAFSRFSYPANYMGKYTSRQLVGTVDLCGHSWDPSRQNKRERESERKGEG